MSRRSRNQSEHDNCVRANAEMLADQGWDVQADLPGFDQPNPIGKDDRIPDIYATLDDQTLIIEVETASTADSHHEQHSTFRRSAAQRGNTEFELVVTEPT